MLFIKISPDSLSFSSVPLRNSKRQTQVCQAHHFLVIAFAERSLKVLTPKLCTSGVVSLAISSGDVLLLGIHARPASGCPSCRLGLRESPNLRLHHEGVQQMEQVAVINPELNVSELRLLTRAVNGECFWQPLNTY